MSNEIADPWAVVTGASSGIGKATAIALAAAGWNVVVHCRSSKSALEDVGRQIESHGRQTRLIFADVADPTAVAQLVDDAWAATGGFAAWVHVAGVDLLTGDKVKLSFEEKLVLATQTDLWGTMLAARAAGRRMFASSSGSIVTIGWDQSATGMDGDSGELFAAIKGGITSFTRSLAKSLAPKVRVNCVAPGWIKTAWGENASDVWQQRVLSETPLQRWGTPDDIAAAIVYLLSDSATFITGQTLAINGGAVTNPG